VTNVSGASPVLKKVLVDRDALEKVWHETVQATSTCPAEVVLEVYARLNKCVERYHTVWDRHNLPQVRGFFLTIFFAPIFKLKNSCPSLDSYQQSKKY